MAVITERRSDKYFTYCEINRVIVFPNPLLLLFPETASVTTRAEEQEAGLCCSRRPIAPSDFLSELLPIFSISLQFHYFSHNEMPAVLFGSDDTGFVTLTGWSYFGSFPPSQGLQCNTAGVAESESSQPGSAPSHFLRCSSTCSMDTLCELWCHETLPINCLFSDMFVMPTYVETNMDDSLTCYTKRHRDLATGASIKGSAINSGFPQRIVVNLVDGIFDRQNLLLCYMTNTLLEQPWFLLDFGEEVAFRLVKIYSQPSGVSSFVWKIRDFEVRVGKEAVATSGDFSSYDWFGSFPGPATEYNQEIIIEVSAPVTGRFLAVQKMMSDTNFQICH